MAMATSLVDRGGASSFAPIANHASSLTGRQNVAGFLRVDIETYVSPSKRLGSRGGGRSTSWAFLCVSVALKGLSVDVREEEGNECSGRELILPRGLEYRDPRHETNLGGRGGRSSGWRDGRGVDI
jgi:hypothetical protein